MNLLPWEYFFQSFDGLNFPDLYMPILVASILMLIATVVVYNVRTRQLHRHTIYVQMYEWLLWTGVVTYSMLITAWIFRFDFILVVATLIVGLGTMVWIRFFRFPPYFAAYSRQLAKARYYSRDKFSHPESTIRAKSSRRRRRR